jgi:hypothetical protein
MDAISFSVHPASLSSVEVVARKSWIGLIEPLPKQIGPQVPKTHPEAVDFERLPSRRGTRSPLAGSSFDPAHRAHEERVKLGIPRS